MAVRLSIALTLVLTCSFGRPASALAGDPTPKVVAVHAAGPMELKVAFDRPAPVDLPEKLVGKRIGFGDKIKAGVIPEGSGLSDPKDPTLGSMRITGAKLEDDEQTLVIATDPHAADTRYTLRIPTDPKALDLTYGLEGVEAAWDNGEPDAKPTWKGWWPTLDAKVARERLAGSAAELSLRSLLGKPGRLTLHSLVTFPSGKVSVALKSNAPFEASIFGESAKSAPSAGGMHSAQVAIEATGEPTDVSITITTAPKLVLSFEGTVTLAGKPGVSLATLPTILPWAPARPPVLPQVPPAEVLYRGGDPKKGAAVFASENAKCANCHRFQGKGTEVGPALDKLVERDPAWVYRQIAEPSAVIHPEFVPYTVVTKDGRVAVGVVRAEGFDTLKVIDTEAKSTELKKSEIEEMRPSSSSIMPVGLTGVVGEEGVRDLIAYLTGGKSK